MKILIGVDDSTQSRDAVSTAFEFFGSNAEYTIASVGERVVSRSGAIFATGYPASTHLTGLDLANEYARAEMAAERAARKAQDSLPPETEASIESELGSVGQQLCRLAEEQASDVIVIGSQDKNVWQRLFDPSVGRYLIDNACCPVLVVR